MAKRTVEEIEAVALAVRAKNQSVKRGHPKYMSNLTSAEEHALTEGVIFLVQEVRRMQQETDRLESAVQGIAGSHARLHAERDALIAERDAYRAMLRDVIASASPSKRDHPAMSAQWKRAIDLLRTGPTEGP